VSLTAEQIRARYAPTMTSPVPLTDPGSRSIPTVTIEQVCRPVTEQVTVHPLARTARTGMYLDRADRAEADDLDLPTATAPTAGALYTDGPDGRYLLGGTWLFRPDAVDVGVSRHYQSSASTAGLIDTNACAEELHDAIVQVTGREPVALGLRYPAKLPKFETMVCSVMICPLVFGAVSIGMPFTPATL